MSCANRIIDVREPLRSIVDAVRTAHRILRIHEFYGITDIRKQISVLTVWDSIKPHKIRWLLQMVVLSQQRLNGDSYYPRITKLDVCLTRDITINPSKYHKRTPLSDPEQITYFKLVSALPIHIILPQVAFSSFITAKGGAAKQNFSRFGQARQKVIDFLVCDKSFEIVAAIELDDSSHIGREKQDEKKNDILNEAGINIIRWYMKSQPDKESLIK